MLAYSSIAHAGYVMVAIAAHNQVGVAAAMFYLAAYSFMNIGAFAVVTALFQAGREVRQHRGLRRLGLEAAHHGCLVLNLLLLSLIGVPLTGGFFGKFYIFKAALDADLVWLSGYWVF